MSYRNVAKRMSFTLKKKTLSMTSTNTVRISKAQNTLSLPKSFKHLAR